MSDLTGGDVLVAAMRAAGVDTAFGVVSIHNLPLVEAVARDLRFVPVRHEAAAVNAADGYARARGRPGVAITSTGTGAGNAAGSMVEALTAGSPVLHVTGQIDSQWLGQGRGVIHETRDQLGMLRAISGHAETIRDPACAGEQLARGLALAARPGHGPVSVEWPIDLQYRPGPVPRDPTQPADPARPDVGQAVAAIAAARRPLVWAGGGATGAGTSIATLLARTGAGLLTSNAGRGTVPEDDPRVVGNFASSDAGAELLAEADLLVSVGTHLRSNETRTYRLALPRPHVQVDVDPAAIGRVHPADVGVVGDAADVVTRIVAELPATTSADPDWVGRVAAARDGARADLRRRIGPQAHLCDVLRAELPRDAVIARDVTIPSSTWGNRLLDILDPTTNVFARGGGIGQGLAMGIGAAVARPEVPTVVLVGDGGLVVHLGELATLAQERPHLVVVVFDDGGYGVLRNLQDAHGSARAGVDLAVPHFGRLAASLDLPHARVADVDEFRPTLRRALASGGPFILEVDVHAIGPMPEPFVPPVHVPTKD